MLPDYNKWLPLSISKLKTLRCRLDWILAGGYALEQFIGYIYRSHDDIDILLPRSCQKDILGCFPIEQIFVAQIPGSLSPFNPNSYYEKPIQDIWILAEDRSAWCLQIMLFDVEFDHWIYKRKESIQLPLSSIYFEKEEMKIIKPEIQLLYKSKSIRSKDQLDFDRIYPVLDNAAKAWLKQSLSACYQDHRWINN